MLDLLLFGAIALARPALAASQPCAAVASASASFMAAFPEATAAYVPADVAEACLSSVPIDKNENMALVEELMLYLSWQSNIEYLLHPPAGYTEQGVDILAKIQTVYNGLSDGTYTDEYHFQADLSEALNEAYDFHLYFIPDILDLFYFQRGNLDTTELFSLISVSTDGQALPQLYNYFDIMRVNNGQTYTPSAISKINGQDAEDYVNNWAKSFQYHDVDGRYNQLFPNQAGLSYGEEINMFVSGQVPDGANTTITHENGTTFTYGNYAKVLVDFSGITSGDDVYQAFLNQGPPTSTKKKRDETKRAQPTATGYPDPVVLHSEGVVGGYYLTGDGYENVAVLSAPSFEPEAQNGATEYQNVVQTFLKEATAAGKNKLIVDLRANGGGRVFLGFDMFKQLFPTMDPYGATRFRANQAFDVAGVAMTEALKGWTYDQAVDDAKTNSHGGGLAQAWASIFNYQVPITTDGKAFKSWDDLFGPHVFNGDNFTSLERNNFNNYFGDDPDMDVSGYGTRANALGKQPFDSNNIVILQDGSCGSTCAVFAELMKAQGNVQQVVIGGTPKTGPMQGVTGSKGGQVWTLMQVWTEASNAYSFLGPDYQEQLNNTEIGKLVYATRPLKRAAYTASGDILAAINLRDNIRMGDTSQTPLEFVYEAADCKLFYTNAMISDPTQVWKATANARWNNNQGCVQGSTGDKSSISGGFKVSNSKKSGAAGLTASSAGLALALVASLMVTAF